MGRGRPVRRVFCLCMGAYLSSHFVAVIRPLMFSFRVALLVLLVGMGATTAWGQPQDSTSESSQPNQVVDRVTEAFVNGRPEQLLGPATDRVELSLFGTRTLYSSAQAFYVLRDFFSNYTPRRFRVDDVTATASSCFVSGMYEHAQSERALQVFVRLVQQDEAWRLHEVRIDHEAE